MRLKLVLFTLLAGLAVALPAGAQEGHPLTGTWLGEWGAKEEQITIVMNWDGKAKTMKGVFNPGDTEMPIKLTMDSAKWTVHLETDYKDDNGKITHIVADGKLENISSYNRTITGDWTQGSEKGKFKIHRD